jgi:hypothetical protein
MCNNSGILLKHNYQYNQDDWHYELYRDRIQKAGADHLR